MARFCNSEAASPSDSSVNRFGKSSASGRSIPWVSSRPLIRFIRCIRSTPLTENQVRSKRRLGEGSPKIAEIRRSLIMRPSKPRGRSGLLQDTEYNPKTVRTCLRASFETIPPGGTPSCSTHEELSIVLVSRFRARANHVVWGWRLRRSHVPRRFISAAGGDDDVTARRRPEREW